MTEYVAEAVTALSARRSGQEVSVSGPRSQATDLRSGKQAEGRAPHGGAPTERALPAPPGWGGNPAGENWVRRQVFQAR